jgi:hypothetical protein
VERSSGSIVLEPCYKKPIETLRLRGGVINEEDTASLQCSPSGPPDPLRDFRISALHLGSSNHELIFFIGLLDLGFGRIAQFLVRVVSGLLVFDMAFALFFDFCEKLGER